MICRLPLQRSRNCSQCSEISNPSLIIKEYCFFSSRKCGWVLLSTKGHYPEWSINRNTSARWQQKMPGLKEELEKKGKVIPVVIEELGIYKLENWLQQIASAIGSRIVQLGITKILRRNSTDLWHRMRGWKWFVLPTRDEKGIYIYIFTLFQWNT